MRSVATLTQGQVVAIDGETLRRSHDRRRQSPALHQVSVWASANRLVLGQVKIANKPNDSRAIPELLRFPDVHGCIVTIAASGTHPKIAQTIIDGGANYVLAIKGNQGQLYEDVQPLF